MKKLILSTCLALTSTHAFADPLVSELKQGQPAPFPGILFGYDEELKIRKDVQKLEIFQERVTLLETENDLLSKKVKLWMDQSESLSKTVVQSYNDSFWKKAGFFALGTLATIGVAYAVKGATK